MVSVKSGKSLLERMVQYLALERNGISSTPSPHGTWLAKEECEMVDDQVECVECGVKQIADAT